MIQALAESVGTAVAAASMVGLVWLVVAWLERREARRKARGRLATQPIPGRDQPHEQP